jgi:hypothetical protein
MMVLDACKNIEEVKVALLDKRVYFPLIRVYFLIYDPGSNSTVTGSSLLRIMLLNGTEMEIPT